MFRTTKSNTYIYIYLRYIHLYSEVTMSCYRELERELFNSQKTPQTVKKSPS